MSKRLKPKSLHTSLRLPPDVSANLATAAGLTGWSTARLVGHLVKLGFAASANNPRTVDELRAAYLGAMKLHAVEKENARRLAEARAAVRAVVAAPHVRKARPAAAKVGRFRHSGKFPPRPAGAVPKLPEASAGSAA